MARILDGAAMAKRMQLEIAEQVSELAKRGVVPCLASLLVGESPASERYISTQEAGARRLGITFKNLRLPADASQEDLLAAIAALNADSYVHGIMVQLPLPKHLDTQRILRMIVPDKDVDCLNPACSDFLSPPCTPAGIMEMLRRYRIGLVGREVVIVGASDIVGKPLAKLMIEARATVTVCHIDTRRLTSHLKRADVLVVAIGCPEKIKGSQVKEGAVVIDVGINRVEGKLVGDVHFASASRKARAITPVPGGVGPMTATMLFAHVVRAAARSSG